MAEREYTYDTTTITATTTHTDKSEQINAILTWHHFHLMSFNFILFCCFFTLSLVSFERSLLLSHQVWHDFCIDTFYALFFISKFCKKKKNKRRHFFLFIRILFSIRSYCRINNIARMHIAHALAQFSEITIGPFVYLCTLEIVSFVCVCDDSNGRTTKHTEIKINSARSVVAT